MTHLLPTEALPDAGPFDVVAPLARGGGGSVWLVRHPGDELAPFVLKQAPLERASALAAEYRALLDTPSP